MALKGKLNQDQINKAAEKVLSDFIESCYDTLEYMGNECVKEARSKGDYRNITGNLRNSVGYVVMHDGTVVRENFKITAKGGEKSELNPMETGRNLATSVGAKFGKNIVLVVVAGMHYAVYVESRGRNVLTSAEQLAKVELPKLIKEIFG